MPEVAYYAACSLDGYIATNDGGDEWLDAFHAGGDDADGAAELYASFDGRVAGAK